MKITIIRHGKTEGNIFKQYIGGKTDQPLAPEGIEELSSVKHLFAPVEKVFASPMRRCVETAEGLYGNQEITCIENLRECDFGKFEGKTHEDLKSEPDYLNWIAALGNNTLHLGESVADFQKRCVMGFNEVIKVSVSEGLTNIAIVCHGGTIMALMDKFSSPHKAFYAWQVSNINGFVFDFDPDKKLFENIKILREN